MSLSIPHAFHLNISYKNNNKHRKVLNFSFLSAPLLQLTLFPYLAPPFFTTRQDNLSDQSQPGPQSTPPPLPDIFSGKSLKRRLSAKQEPTDYPRLRGIGWPIQSKSPRPLRGESSPRRAYNPRVNESGEAIKDLLCLGFRAAYIRKLLWDRFSFPFFWI